MKEILELMKHFDQLSISEMDLEYHGIKVFFKKEKQEVISSLEKNKVFFREEEKNKEEISVKEAGEEKETDVEEKKKVICAPLTGTFYRSPAPGESPYILPGQKVKKGDVLGVIEAMKMMNEIVADEEGVVEEILAEDESMVEYEQPLIVIR